MRERSSSQVRPVRDAALPDKCTVIAEYVVVIDGPGIAGDPRPTRVAVELPDLVDVVGDDECVTHTNDRENPHVEAGPGRPKSQRDPCLAREHLTVPPACELVVGVGQPLVRLSCNNGAA